MLRLWVSLLFFIFTGCGDSGSSSSSSSSTTEDYPDLVSEVNKLSQWGLLPATNPPDVSCSHTAIWTGTQLLTFGGRTSTTNFLQNGRVYNPSSNSWSSMNSSGMPSARAGHTSVWTGSEMIIFGGFGNGAYLNTGSRYSPSTNTWSAISATNAPVGRAIHTAVWTGNRMIVFGGMGSGGNYFNSGAIYNPTSNVWTPIANAPTARSGHTAVWTGSEMIVFGGKSTNAIPISAGEIYYPETNTWRSVNTLNQPVARHDHSAVWTGSKMIVFGGQTADPLVHLNNGAIYDFALDEWQPLPLTGVAPVTMGYHEAIWTGRQMLVVGGAYRLSTSWGYVRTVYAFDFKTQTWETISSVNAPSERSSLSATWTGQEILVFGGGTRQSIDTPTTYNCNNDLYRIH